METNWHSVQSNILGTNFNLLGRLRHNVSFQVQEESNLGMFGYVDLHIWIFVCLPKPGTRRQVVSQTGVPFGENAPQHISSIFYIIPIPTSLFLLTFFFLASAVYRHI